MKQKDFKACVYDRGDIWQLILEQSTVDIEVFHPRWISRLKIRA